MERRTEPKRILDLTLGSALLVLAAPLLMAAALTVAAGLPADGILVREYRTGLSGHPFIVRSLRTRRFRLDLLSRLPHVVRGEMSLVGPAPLPLGSPAAAPPWRQRLRPGLTGLAQVRRHSTLPWDEAALLDQHYAEHHWIGLDLAVLARTLPALRLAHRRRHPRTHTPLGRRAGRRYRARLSAPPAPLSDTRHRPRHYIAARELGNVRID
jgi:lipopolysaccharide/colanic/teichoic acid biosynthesis glycosyltransferase